MGKFNFRKYCYVFFMACSGDDGRRSMAVWRNAAGKRRVFHLLIKRGKQRVPAPAEHTPDPPAAGKTGNGRSLSPICPSRLRSTLKRLLRTIFDGLRILRKKKDQHPVCPRPAILRRPIPLRRYPWSHLLTGGTGKRTRDTTRSNLWWNIPIRTEWSFTRGSIRCG